MMDRWAKPPRAQGGGRWVLALCSAGVVAAAVCFFCPRPRPEETGPKGPIVECVVLDIEPSLAPWAALWQRATAAVLRPVVLGQWRGPTRAQSCDDKQTVRLHVGVLSAPTLPGAQRVELALRWSKAQSDPHLGARGRLARGQAEVLLRPQSLWPNNEAEAGSWAEEGNGAQRHERLAQQAMAEALQRTWRQHALLTGHTDAWIDALGRAASAPSTMASPDAPVWADALLAIECFKQSRLRAGVWPLLEVVHRGTAPSAEAPGRLLALQAVVALGRIGDARASLPLIDASLRQSSEHVVQTAYAVAQMGGRFAAGYLHTMAEGHDDERVRQAAADALADLPPRQGKLP